MNNETLDIPDVPRIVLYGNNILREECVLVKENENIDGILAEMMATMYSLGGIGLAAPQIGELKSIIIWDNDWVKSKKKYENINVMVNPKIIEESKEEIPMLEACLSLPGLEGVVYRPRKILVEYETVDRNKKREEFLDVDTRVILHEIDHLSGKLFIDRLSPRDRSEIVNQLVMLRQVQKKKQALSV